MITFLPETRADLLAVRASGKVTLPDYVEFRNRAEGLMRTHGKVRVFLELEDFRGIEPRAAWEDLKLGLGHLGRFERCALVGDRRWEAWMVELARPFFRVEFFDRSQRNEAWSWLAGPAVPAGQSENWLNRLTGVVRRHPLPAALLGAGLFLLLLRATAKRHPRTAEAPQGGGRMRKVADTPGKAVAHLR
jgi:hypothetical protein